MTKPNPDLIYPCFFPLKVIGKLSDGFESIVVDIVKKHVPELDQNTISTKPSKEGKYLSVSMHFTAKSRAQVDALYMELGKHPEIVYIL